jgi:hypothetical protein
MFRILFVSSAAMLTLMTVSSPAFAERLVAVADGGRLISFRASDPANLLSSTMISGLNVGASLVGIDYRPATRQLYGLSSDSRLYTLSMVSGKATEVGMLNVPLMGSFFGMDFNPTVDRLRVVSDTGQNLRINPDNAVVATNLSPGGDLPLNYSGTPAKGIVAAAYTNNVADAKTTTLYVIDSLLDLLVIQGPMPPVQGPNQGALAVVGPIGFNATPRTGFDISGATGLAYVSSGNNLWTIDLTLASAPKLLGPIAPGRGLEIATISVAPVPEPGAWAMIVTGMVGLVAAYRRRK